MGLTFLTGYVLGQHGAQSAKLASSVAGRSGASSHDVLDLNERLDRLILVVDAMWSLLEDAGYTDEQLVERIEQIDLLDGTADGRRKPVATTCSNCEAKVAGGLPSCQFCGTPVPGAADPIDSL
jgi:hypothetical protein